MSPSKIIEEFEVKYNVTVVYFHIAGSRLYGTNTPESDIDYRGIFIPTIESLVLKQDLDQLTFSTGTKDQKNTEKDIDITFWSLHKFLKLLQVGDTNAFDTLWSIKSPSNLYQLPVMEEVMANREAFYPETLRSFFGYALGQVKLYSSKGKKLEEVIQLQALVKDAIDNSEHLLVSDILPIVKLSDNLKIVTDDTNTYLKVLDKRFMQTITLTEFLVRIAEIEQKYGSRAKASMENNAVDYKALYHAFRVLYECRELMLFGHINFPLVDSILLLNIRNKSYEPEMLFNMLEALYDLISDLEKSDRNYLKYIEKHDTNKLLKDMLWKYFKLVGASEIKYLDAPLQTMTT